MDGKISEQRVYCKIRAQLGFPQTVYGNGALKYATVCKWVCRFDDGRESIENDPRVGRLVSVLTEKERCYCSSIPSSSVLKILHERLGLRKICACWVPHLQADEQKQSRVRLASQVIEK